MSDARIYEVRAESDTGVHSFGARRTRAEADALLDDSKTRVQRVGGRNSRYWIEEIDTSGLFDLPVRPTPRVRYTTRVTKTSAEGAWATVHVEIAEGQRVAASYDRNYAMLRTFEPFRQGQRDFALISPDYTATSVVDLANGEIIAAEQPQPGGFCPVGFYVPDWWDVHEGLERSGILPGSMQWRDDYEWPVGDFGFVWGCIWGDDSSWKVQYLDLSRVREGVLTREERFGYVILDTGEPEGREVWRDAREFIDPWSYNGTRRVAFRTLQTYDLKSGELQDPLD
jgi:hypothetical protein